MLVSTDTFVRRRVAFAATDRLKRLLALVEKDDFLCEMLTNAETVVAQSGLHTAAITPKIGNNAAASGRGTSLEVSKPVLARPKQSPASLASSQGNGGAKSGRKP